MEQGSRDPLEDADRFTAAARVDEAARERRRRSATTARSLELVDPALTLLGAVDHQVTVHLAGSAPVVGQVFAVGEDVVELHSGSTTWWLSLAAITAVESTGPLLGDPADRSATSLAEVLCDLVDTRERVTALLVGEVLHGEVRACGASLVLELHQPARTAVIRLDRVLGLTRRSSGTTAGQRITGP